MGRPLQRRAESARGIVDQTHNRVTYQTESMLIAMLLIAGQCSLCKKVHNSLSWGFCFSCKLGGAICVPAENDCVFLLYAQFAETSFERADQLRELGVLV